MNFYLLLKIWVKNIGKNISKNLSGKYKPGMLAMCQELLDQAIKICADPLKTSPKRVIQKTAEATGGLIGNKIAKRIKKISKNSKQINSERVTNEHDKEIPNER